MDALQLILVGSIVGLVVMNLMVLLWLPTYIGKQMQQRQLTTSKLYDVHVDNAQVVSEMDMSEVQKQARLELLATAKETAKRMQEALENSVDQIVANINDMASTQLSQEFEKYQVSLQALRDQSIAEFTEIQKELDTRKAQLLERLEREVTKEQERRVDQLTGRMNDVVASYLTETLGNQVDLGAQSGYIFAALQQHKDDIKRNILL